MPTLPVRISKGKKSTTEQSPKIVGKKTLSENLRESREGICLGGAYAQLIWQKRKGAIVKSKFYRGHVGKLLYLIGDNTCYGLVKLSLPDKITLQEFEELYKTHLVTASDRKKWWPNKEILYYYKFNVIQRFNTPRKIKISKRMETFVKDFEFVDDKVSVQSQEIKSSVDLSDKKLWDTFQDSIIIKNFASIIGSVVNPVKNQEHKTLDIYLGMAEPPESLKKSIELMLCRDFPHWKLLNFVWNSQCRPSENFIPLFDLSLNRIRPFDVVNVSHVSDLSPMHASKSFSDVGEALKYMFKTGRKYALERKVRGTRSLVSKTRKSVKIFNDEGVDMTSKYESHVDAILNMSNKDFIVDCEVQEGVFNCFDILRVGNEDLTGKNWFERKQLLHSLHYSDRIKEVNSIIVGNIPQAKQAIHLLCALRGSVGVVIKQYDGGKSVYVPGGTSLAWINFSDEELTPTLADGNTTTGTSGIAGVQGKYIVKKPVKPPKKKV